MNQPRLSQLRTWNNHEKRVIELLILALILLQQKTDLNLSQINEEALNSELYFCLIEANRVMYLQNKGFDHPPTAEGRNPPDADDRPDSPRKKKIPDFYWGYIDHLEPDPRRSARNFYIECKRLGKPLQRDKVLTTLYVQNGIRRFVTKEHAYAKGERSSAMVGYVQNMTFDAVLVEVNTTAGSITETITPLNLVGTWQEEGVSRLDHILQRPFPVSPLRLYHFWVDLRNRNDD